ncbi:uncharacterized protein LOC135344736 [Halichondria panicea]|uniref:uncharacterized protein LOC135344736 n=1 Tax=Halichondria panicea TaxID=6063 RepID=UPI00312B2D95
MLSKVSSSELSLAELKEEATSYRSRKSLQRAFCKITTSSTWCEAKRRFPAFTTPERLRTFHQICLTKTIPASFRSYCEAALKAEKSGSTDTVVPSADIYKFRHCKAYVVEGDAANMCCQDVRDVYPTFMGSNLFLADIPVAWTTEQIQSLVYTTKQLNTIPEKTVSTFNVALISTSLSKIEELKNCLLKCYEHVSVCYWQTACTGGLDSTHPLGFIPSIGCVVVGHYSLSGKLEEDHFNFVEEGRSNFFPCIDQSTAKIPICVLTGIIKKLSFEGSTVIDATSESGNCAIASLQAGRDVVVLKALAQAALARSQLAELSTT